MLKFVYTIFVGLLIVAFVGLGIDAFYSGPDYPEYPTRLERPYPVTEKEEDLTTEEKEARNEEFEKYQVEQEKYETESKLYNRNVSIIVLSVAILILVLSLAFATQLAIISDGAILGGVFTLIYGIIRGIEAGDPKFRFLVVTVGLIVAIILGYLKFIRPKSTDQP